MSTSHLVLPDPNAAFNSANQTFGLIARARQLRMQEDMQAVQIRNISQGMRLAEGEYRIRQAQEARTNREDLRMQRVREDSERARSAVRERMDTLFAETGSDTVALQEGLATLETEFGHLREFKPFNDYLTQMQVSAQGRVESLQARELLVAQSKGTASYDQKALAARYPGRQIIETQVEGQTLYRVTDQLDAEGQEVLAEITQAQSAFDETTGLPLEIPAATIQKAARVFGAEAAQGLAAQNAKNARLRVTSSPDYLRRQAEQEGILKGISDAAETNVEAGLTPTEESLPAAMQKDYIELAEGAQAMAEINRQVQAISDDDLDKVVGGFSPTINTLFKRFGDRKDPEGVQELNARIVAELKRISGAAISEGEYQRFARGFADARNNPKAFKAQVQAWADRVAAELGRRNEMLSPSYPNSPMIARGAEIYGKLTETPSRNTSGATVTRDKNTQTITID
jgi:hypothetical protein